MLKHTEQTCWQRFPVACSPPAAGGGLSWQFWARVLLVTGLYLPSLLGCAAKLEQQEGSAAHQTDLGVQVVVMQRTAAGNMLDFRFRVLDPDKAMPLFREDIFPYLIDQKYQIPLKVTDTTKVGPMRPTSRDPRVGKVYFMFFRNPNRYVQTGQKVTLVAGDHRIPDLVVQ